tara:strand:- start:1041 stop:2024 length:984 start_codon:yes stop_codon:yes gene_type:complete
LKKIIYSPGEPAGIGPDIIINLSQTKDWMSYKVPILTIGDKKLFEQRAKVLKKKIKIIEIKDPSKIAPNKAKTLQVYKVIDCVDVKPGKLNNANAEYVIRNLNFAIKECLKSDKSALVTGPISKENVMTLNKRFVGHTEHIKKVTKSNDVLMMLASDKLRVALATTHIPLKRVPEFINQNLIINKTQILNDDLKRKFKIKKPKIKILGLNPHAGENGKIGSEEKNVLIPAIKKLRKKKIDVSYPISADTAFSKKSLKETDAYLGMYHDQVLPVLKALSFGNSINISLGIPIIRTSVDHGVALDVAGTNNSDISSLKLAIKTAKTLIK